MVECVAVDMRSATHVLGQTVALKYVSAIGIQRVTASSWTVEITAHHEPLSRQDELVKHVGQLSTELLRHGTWWTVNAGDDNLLGWT